MSSAVYSSCSKDLSLRKIEEFARAQMLGNRRVADQEVLTGPEAQLAEERSVRLARKFGHLICERARTDDDGASIPAEALPITQLDGRTEDCVRKVRLQLERWFSASAGRDEISCFDAFCTWVMVACFSGEAAKARYTKLVTESHRDGLLVSDASERVAESLARCYHFQAYIAFFVATLAFNRAPAERDEEVKLEQIAAARGVVVCPPPNPRQAHSHTAFGRFMHHTHFYSHMEMVGQAKPRACQLCGIGGQGNTGKSLAWAINLSKPYPGVERDGSSAQLHDTVQYPVCNPCGGGLQAWWTIYHFMDIVVPKKMESFIQGLPPVATPRTLEGTVGLFLKAHRKEMLNMLNIAVDSILVLYTCYFVKNPDQAVLQESFEDLDMFTRFMGVKRADMFENALSAVLGRGLALDQPVVPPTQPLPDVPESNVAVVAERAHRSSHKRKRHRSSHGEGGEEHRKRRKHRHRRPQEEEILAEVSEGDA